MLLWVGLGNPEPNMRIQRHNVGFMAVDRIAETYQFSPWRARFKGETAEGHIGKYKVLLLKPMTYMNASGESVRAAKQFYKTQIQDVTVFHDELDLDLGRIRVKRGGGAAGHNGLRSIDRALSDQGYQRVRIGIGRPAAKEQVTGYVLGNFAQTESDCLDRVLKGISQGALRLADNDANAFMTKLAVLCGEKRPDGL